MNLETVLKNNSGKNQSVSSLMMIQKTDIIWEKSENSELHLPSQQPQSQSQSSRSFYTSLSMYKLIIRTIKINGLSFEHFILFHYSPSDITPIHLSFQAKAPSVTGNVVLAGKKTFQFVNSSVSNSYRGWMGEGREGRKEEEGVGQVMIGQWRSKQGEEVKRIRWEWGKNNRSLT